VLLTISVHATPATDLGYLLAKNPARTHSFQLPFGTAHVFFPEASDAKCTAALLVDLDAIGLVRSRVRNDDAPLAQYVNDRPYAASSFLSVAIGRVFGTAMSGKCRDRPDLPAQALPFEVALYAVPCRGGDAVARRLFEPLGYRVAASRLPLDDQFPEWGESRFYDLSLAATARLADILTHLAVLIPVLDDQKHYWVGADEVDKLLDRGEGWLAEHPARDLIVERSLKHRRGLVRDALDRLSDEGEPAEVADDATPGKEEALETPMKLNEVRLARVHEVLTVEDVRSVVDLGCGEGQLLGRLARDKRFHRVVGVDVSLRSLEIAQRRLDPERLPSKVAERVTLLHGSATYRDARLKDFDAACLVEVVEHVEPARHSALERVVFGEIRPRVVIVTTPNVEYNVRFENPPGSGFRHRDHRFEWSRAEFASWSARVAEQYGYAVRHEPIGPVDPELGAPTQMGVFTR
jgi:3' terminal RNA ribose 2'-O-methyltransferase Hen1